MVEQEPLDDGERAPAFDPEHNGLWRRLRSQSDPYRLDPHAVNRARAENAPVGSCRACGGYLFILPTPPKAHQAADALGVDMVEFECRSCGKQTAAPGHRMLARSSRHSRAPGRFWPGRNKILKAGDSPPAPAPS